MNRNFKDDLKIDLNNLEDEWIEQPSIFMYYAEAHAEAIEERDTIKARMEYIYSKIYDEAKKGWEKYFEKPPTEGALKEHVLRNPRYKKAEKALISATKDVNILAGVKSAMDHKKRALENLVSMKISGFHSEPRLRNQKNARQVEKKQFTAKQRRQRNRKTKK